MMKINKLIQDRIKQIIKIIFMNIILIGVGFIILELIFGNWFSPNNLNRLNNIKDSRLHYHNDFYKGEDIIINYTRDKFGFRGDYDNVNNIDILTIGGSTTDQRYITDGKTWQDIIRKNFLESDKKDISVLNAGIDGQSTYGHIKNFDWLFKYIPNLNVKYYLFYVGLNDFYKDEFYRFDNLVNESNSIRAIIKGRSVFYYICRTLRNNYRAKKILKIGHGSINFHIMKWTNKPIINQDRKSIMKFRLDQFEKRLEVLIQKVYDSGGKPIFVSQPSRLYKFVDNELFGIDGMSDYDDVKYNGVDYFYMLENLSNRMFEVCKKNNVIYIDLFHELDFEDDDFYDYGHNTPKGAEKIGNFLYNKLKILF